MSSIGTHLDVSVTITTPGFDIDSGILATIDSLMLEKSIIGLAATEIGEVEERLHVQAVFRYDRMYTVTPPIMYTVQHNVLYTVLYTVM